MMNRSFYASLMVGAALVLTGCASPYYDDSLNSTAGLTPLSRYSLKVEDGYDRIALALRQDALSANQRTALSSLASRYLASGSDQLVIEVDPQAGTVGGHMANNVVAALEGYGVPRHRIGLVSYEGPGAGSPVVAGFKSLRAHVPQCGTQWGSLSSTANNNGASNFGCAVNANLAAQIADPRDIVAPRTMTPPSAQRRTVVFDLYRQGQPTSSQREQLMSAAQVSNAVE